MSSKASKDLLPHIFSYADIFEQRVHLTLHKKRTLSTTLGGVLTIILVIFIATQVFPPLVSLREHDNPQLYQINELEDDPASVYLSRSRNFFLAALVSINDVNVNLSAISPLNFQTTVNKYIRLTNGTKVKVKYPIVWAPCNASDFDESIYGKAAFQTYSLDYGYCARGINYTDQTTGVCPDEYASTYPDCIVSDGYDIQGTFLSQEFDFIQSNIVLCNSSDPTLPSQMRCDTSNIASQFSASVFKLNLYYANTLINPMSYAQPNKTAIDVVYWNLNPLILKIADIFVDRITVQNYDDYITNDYNNHSFYAIQAEKMRELDSVQSSAGVILLQWNLRRSGLNIVYSRTYGKIQEILADLGGFSGAIVVIASVIAVGYVRYKYLMMIANDLYDFKKPLPHKRPMPKVNALNMLSIENSEAKVLGPESPMSLLGVNESRVIQEYFEARQARKPLKYNEWQYFKTFLDLLCCRTSVEEKLGKKGRVLANKDIDIIYTMRKLQEVDRLKQLLFDEHQTEAFDYIDKPLITVGNQRAENFRKSVSIVKFSRKALPSDRVITERSERSESLVKSEQPKLQKKKTWKDKVPLSKFAKLYVAYRGLLDDEEPENQVFNRKLLGMLDRNLIKVFQRVDQLVGDEPDQKEFEDAVKQSLNDTGDVFI